jgi:hypothetical protein
LSIRAGLSPGKDVLHLPLALAAGSQRSGWPTELTSLEIRNVGGEAVVVDNVRLGDPQPPPAGAVLLDFGPRDQALWPGFEPAEADGTGITWSGNSRIYAYSLPFPDPLLGDFAGPNLYHPASETLTIHCPKGPGQVWLWLTHFDSGYTQPPEYQAKLNGRVVLQGRLAPAQVLSPEGLLEGKDQPWTPEWFAKTYLPKTFAKVESPLNAGTNALELLDAQVSALVVAPRSAAEATRAYLQRLDWELDRFRRQFVLCGQQRPRCDLAPTEEEAKAGVSFFLPPADECYSPRYVPLAEHRAKLVKMLAAAGSSVSSAVVVVPGGEAGGLQVSSDTPTDPAKGTIPPGNCHALLLEPLPGVRQGMLTYQPFLPARALRAVQAKGVYWLYLNLTVPERTPPGLYRGTIRVSAGSASGQLPFEVEVARLAGGAAGPAATFGVFSEADASEIYHSLKQALPPPRQSQFTRDVFARLFAAGLNAGMVQGPSLARGLTPDPAPMVQALQAYPASEHGGKVMVNLAQAMGTLRSSGIQPGTARHVSAIRDLVKTGSELAGRAGLKDYALFLSFAHPASELDEAAKLAGLFRAAGGRPAVATYASNLALLPQGQRGELFAGADTLLCDPNHKDFAALGDAFKKAGAGKTLLVLCWHPDAYTFGFYCWGAGADGALAGRIFATTPQYNPFWFDGLSLLLPNAQGGLEPTLALLQFQQGMEDYALARRCDALAKAARQRGLDASGLEKVLASIRLAADSDVPRFDQERYRPATVLPEQLKEWRTLLVQEGAWLSQKMASPY